MHVSTTGSLQAYACNCIKQFGLFVSLTSCGGGASTCILHAHGHMVAPKLEIMCTSALTQLISIPNSVCARILYN